MNYFHQALNSLLLNVLAEGRKLRRKSHQVAQFCCSNHFFNL